MRSNKKLYGHCTFSKDFKDILKRATGIGIQFDEGLAKICAYISQQTCGFWLAESCMRLTPTEVVMIGIFVGI